MCEAGGPVAPHLRRTRLDHGVRLDLPLAEDHYAWLLETKAFWTAFVVPPAPVPATSSSSPSRPKTRRLIRRLDRARKLRQIRHRSSTALTALKTTIDTVVDNLDAAAMCTNCMSNPAQYVLHAVSSTAHTTCDACVEFHRDKTGASMDWLFCACCQTLGEGPLTPITSITGPVATALGLLRATQSPDPATDPSLSFPLPEPPVSALDAGEIARILQLQASPNVTIIISDTEAALHPVQLPVEVIDLDEE